MKVAPPGLATSDRRVRLAYILAASHSGSTLLAMLLGAHPEICTVGELNATALGDPDRYLCSCRRKIKACPFWKAIAQDMRDQGFTFVVTNFGTDIRSGASPYVLRLLSPLHRGPALELIRDLALSFSPIWRSMLPRVQTLNTALMRSVLARTGKKIIVDSSKIGIRLKYLLRNPHLDVKVLRLIRDGRAVALTYMDPAQFADARDPSLRGGGTGEGRDGERLPMVAAAREWRRSNEEADVILKRLDKRRWLEVRYEDLCSRTDDVLKTVLAFLGTHASQATTAFRSVEHHVLGNGMRLDLDNFIGLDERWKTALTRADLDVFESVAGQKNRSLGYC